MASIVLGLAEFKSYLAGIGPGLGHPERPRLCLRCDGVRIWFDGWRVVFSVVLADGAPHRFDEGIPLQRVRCATCKGSWTLRPAALYPHRSLQPDVAEAAALSYLSQPDATYQKTAEDFGCSPRSVWRWTGSLAALLDPPALVAEAELLAGTGQSAALIPHSVPQDHSKALSPQREAVLLRAFQGLVALAVWARSASVPPQDPSPLRCWLAGRFLVFLELHLLVPGEQSPGLPGDSTGPP